MYQSIKLIITATTLISLTQAMHSPIRANAENDQSQLVAPQNIQNQHHNLVIVVKQLAKKQKIDLKELCIECHLFKKMNGRLPLINEAVTIAANLKKQYIRQDEISQAIMSHIFVDQDDTQAPRLEGYQHADSIVDHLDI
jgi:hypothetical protein